MSAAFDAVFGVFVVAIVTLAVVAVRWGIRRDRLARSRQAEQPPRAVVPGAVPDEVPAAPQPAPDRHAT